MGKLKSALPHIAAVILFIITALLFFNPVLQGKKLFQSDIAQYKGMSKEQTDFREKEGEEPYWTNSAFGGMPTYQLGAQYPYAFVKKIDKTIRFLPRPADYLFLYFVGFYILLLVMKVDYRLAFLGAIAFGFSTYNIIIFEAGHNAKAHAIGYFPLLLAGILLLFQRKYLWGFLLTSLAMALELVANHVQMTYYYGLLVVIMGLFYLYDAFKSKQLAHFFKAVGLAFLAVLLGLSVNATNLLATKEYAAWSTRGKSPLTTLPDGSPKEVRDGLDPAYITQYSVEPFESLNVFVPRIMGGGSTENLGDSSHIYDFLMRQGVPASQAGEFAAAVPTYWGEQIIVGAPPYIGAVVLFLFVLGCFIVPPKQRWWLLAGTFFALLLSWGRHFEGFTNFMIDYFPLYNKFRAVSSIQVVMEFCAPLMAVLALQQWFSKEITAEKKQKILYWSGGIVVGFCLFLFGIQSSLDFSGAIDGRLAGYGQEFIDIIKKDRKEVYTSDLFRTSVYVLLTIGVLWLVNKEKLKMSLGVGAILLLVIFDLVGINNRYLSKEDYVRARVIDKPFQATQADKSILKDTSHYRVLDMTTGLNGARSSFFHHSLGGYHAAKPGRLQEIWEYQIAKGNMGLINMLEVKYILDRGEDGKLTVSKNPYTNGNAWFVNQLQAVQNADEEMAALEELPTDSIAVFNQSLFPDRTIQTYVKDSLAHIELLSYKPNHLVYRSNNQNKGMAVFSEMYYQPGWNAYIDGELQSHIQVNYVLRAMEIPAGTHQIEFKFEPKVIAKGSTITLTGGVIWILVFAAGMWYRKKQQPQTND
ncbi:MAG: YfhO family protein [Flavobacteriaceae bacterium]|nr:YfhO family protein [Flavobacteriaceae bacterium]